jgi:hypothetical protein
MSLLQLTQAGDPAKSDCEEKQNKEDVVNVIHINS